MTATDWRDRVRREFIRAAEAEAAGNEGMARVCARRAAGWTIQAYLRKRGLTAERPSALEQIKFLNRQQDLDADIREVLEHMLQHLAKDHPQAEAYWPLEANLLEEARWLAQRLFPDLELSKKRR